MELVIIGAIALWAYMAKGTGAAGPTTQPVGFTSPEEAEADMRAADTNNPPPGTINVTGTIKGGTTTAKTTLTEKADTGYDPYKDYSLPRHGAIH